MLRVLGVLFLIALYIYFIIDVLRTPPGQSRTLPKLVWLIVVIVIPILGGLLWLALGRIWPSPGSRFGRRRAPIAPDDNPAFLREIGNQAWSERMKRRREGPST